VIAFSFVAIQLPDTYLKRQKCPTEWNKTMHKPASTHCGPSSLE